MASVCSVCLTPFGLLPSRSRPRSTRTCELFGKVREVPQSETRPFYPRPPYGVKQVVRLLNRGQLPGGLYDTHTSKGILFNHEPSRRGCLLLSRAGCRAPLLASTWDQRKSSSWAPLIRHAIGTMREPVST